MLWDRIERKHLSAKQQLVDGDSHVWWWPESLQPRSGTRRQRTEQIQRCLLARYVEADPDSLLFGREAKGRPYLRHAGAPDFNLSDTGGGTVMVVTMAGRIGIDIERIDRAPPVMRLATRWYGSDEAHALSQMDPESARRAFLRLWTAKEAACKATGTGIFGVLSSWRFAVTAGEESPQLVDLPAGSGEFHRWRFHRLAPTPFHTVVLACLDNQASPLGFQVVE